MSVANNKLLADRVWTWSSEFRKTLRSRVSNFPRNNSNSCALSMTYSDACQKLGGMAPQESVA
jgi:hypothetical protein